MVKKRLFKGFFCGLFFENVLLCILSAFIFYLIIYFRFYFLIWISLVPVFYFALREKRLVNILFFASLTGFMIFLSFYWLSAFSVRFYWFMSFVVSFFAFLIGLFYFYLSRFKVFYDFRFLFFPVIWLFFIFLFSFFEYGNMWLKFAYFQPMMFPLGYFLGSSFYTIFIILFNSLVAEFFYSRNKKVFWVIVVFLLLIVFSGLYSFYKVPVGEELRIVLVQGNVDELWEVRLGNPDRFLGIYEDLTLQAKDFSPDFVFWPEYSLSVDLSKNKEISEKISEIAREMNSYIVLGAFAFVDEEKIDFYDLKYDRVYVFSPNGSFYDFYDAWAVQSVYGDIVSFEGSDNFISSDLANFLIGVCFEEYMGIKNFNEDVDFISFLSNNQHFDNTMGIYLISQFSKLRALENNRYVVRVSNSGISQVINPYGKVEAEIESYVEGIVFTKIYI